MVPAPFAPATFVDVMEFLDPTLPPVDIDGELTPQEEVAWNEMEAKMDAKVASGEAIGLAGPPSPDLEVAC